MEPVQAQAAYAQAYREAQSISGENTSLAYIFAQYGIAIVKNDALRIAELQQHYGEYMMTLASGSVKKQKIDYKFKEANMWLITTALSLSPSDSRWGAFCERVHIFFKALSYKVTFAHNITCAWNSFHHAIAVFETHRGTKNEYYYASAAYVLQEGRLLGTTMDREFGSIDS